MTELLFDHKHKPHIRTMSKEELNGLLAGLNNDPIVIGEEAFTIIEKAIEENPMRDNTELQALLKRHSRWVDSGLS